MNHETDDGHANAGVGHIKCRPGMRERNVKVEEEEIDDVAVDQTVGEISKHTRQQQGERYVPQRIRRATTQEQRNDEEQCQKAKDDKGEVVVFENAEGGTGVCYIHDVKNIRNHYVWRLVGDNKPKYKPFCDLIECIERQRNQENEFHLATFPALATTCSQRSQSSRCVALAPTLGRCRQQRAHF